MSPFEKNIESLFIVGSPFQVLCAYSAILEFHIQKYRIIVPLVVNEPRNEQTLTVLNFYDLDYEIVDHTSIKCSDIIRRKFKHDYKKYSRVFVANFFQLDYRALALSCVNPKGHIVFLDDGTITLDRFFHNYTLGHRWKFLNCMLNVYSKIKRISCNNYYTIFHDVVPGSYSCYRCDLKKLQKDETTCLSEIYFIGTNTNVFCKAYGIEIKFFYEILESLFVSLKNNHPNKKIVYIPHGRDTDNIIPSICKKHGFYYQRINICIEVYFISKNIEPFEILGFGSTALLTLKNIFENTNAYNLQFKTDKVVYDNIKKYYEKHDILTINL